MDFSRIRIVLSMMVNELKTHTHKELPGVLEKLGIVEPEDEIGRSKAERLEAALSATPDHELPRVAERLLEHYPPNSSAERNVLQDLVWPPGPEIPKRYRRDIATALDIHELFRDAKKFDRLLEDIFVLEDESTWVFGAESWIRGEIDQHVYRNPGDWDVSQLFENIGAFEVSNTRFGRFIEGLASADVLTDEGAQRSFVELVNGPLSGCGLELRESGTREGYPEFRIVDTRSGSKSKPKNLIFASQVKPDLRFQDAINNDVEIVTNKEKVLVYDRHIAADIGLRWCELQDWWKSLMGIDDEQEAKETLYRRLQESLPESSPPQQMLFDQYHRKYGKLIPRLPALLPEVWLHWDPILKARRGAKALVHSRMDFLMLLRHGVRVVIEVDGKQHYSTDDKPDVTKYATMVAADRKLKMDGYQVFRFGGAELKDDVNGRMLVDDFFESMFARFGVDVS